MKFKIIVGGVMLLAMTLAGADIREKKFYDTKNEILVKLAGNSNYNVLRAYFYKKKLLYVNNLNGVNLRYKGDSEEYAELKRDISIESFIVSLQNGTVDYDEKYVTITYKPKNEKEKRTIPNHISFKYLEDESKWVIEQIGFIYE